LVKANWIDQENVFCTKTSTTAGKDLQPLPAANHFTWKWSTLM